MKFPDDVRKQLARRFRNRHRDWLATAGTGEPIAADDWPVSVNLGVPTENQAGRQIEAVHAWVSAWQNWRGAGALVWGDRRWRTLGTQRMPEKLLLADPGEVAQWVGEAYRWDRAQCRYAELTTRWPRLNDMLPRYFDTLADYGDADYRRLIDLVAWVAANPASNLYPRQVPVPGLDSKWLEGRRRLLADLVGAIRGQSHSDGDVYQRCGLRAPPQLIRLRLLDRGLRERFGGLGDLSVPAEQLVELDIAVANVFIVENLQTGLAFDDLPDSMVIMQLGYGVDVLGHLPWLTRARCFYWGDLDTHGFAILNRARARLRQLQSLLMDEETLFRHRDMWVKEDKPHGADTLPLLSDSELAVYQAIRQNTWGQSIRLEQERIAWNIAWQALRRAI